MRTHLSAVVLLVASLLVAPALVVACSGANGDSPPVEPEGGVDAGDTVVIVQCGDAAAE